MSAPGRLLNSDNLAQYKQLLMRVSDDQKTSVDSTSAESKSQSIVKASQVSAKGELQDQCKIDMKAVENSNSAYFHTSSNIKGLSSGK